MRRSASARLQIVKRDAKRGCSVRLDLRTELAEFRCREPGRAFTDDLAIRQLDHPQELAFEALVPSLSAVQPPADDGLLCDLRQHAFPPVAPILGLGALARAAGQHQAPAILQPALEEWVKLAGDDGPCLSAAQSFFYR